ncbi:hypothetical protein F4808DRAFT_454956 [Astrocystis sublimbata]|nr:hypothetical protein F4808DRAFT_454956 [Astrocystis sublimbata]
MEKELGKLAYPHLASQRPERDLDDGQITAFLPFAILSECCAKIEPADIMRLVIVALALTSGILAQDLGALPDCAKGCVAEFTTGGKIGDCAQLDAKCICSSDSFINGIACCLAGVCDADDQKKAVTCSSVSATSTPHPSTQNTSPTSTETPSPTADVTPNVGSPAGFGSNTGFYGGLLAVLALL